MQQKKIKKNAIKQYMVDNGIKQSFFAKKCKVTQSSLCGYMRGEDMFVSTAKRICETANGMIKVDDIAKGIEK